MISTDFERQLAELEPELLRFTRRFVQSQEDSKDLVQETMLKALSYRASFRENKNLIGWLYIIMRNIFINHYRKNSRVRISALSDPTLTRRGRYSFWNADEPARLGEVWMAIDSIAHDLSTPFKMHLSGYKYDEIAEHLKIPLGTVKNRIFLARQEIRNHLPGYL